MPPPPRLLVRIEGRDLPGRSCGPSPDRPGGHHGIHVALQGRGGPADLVGLTPGDADEVAWELDAVVLERGTGLDLRGPMVHGGPGRRYLYLSWVVTGDGGPPVMFRRAKISLAAVPAGVLAAAAASGRLVGRLGLRDGRGNPRCAAVPAGDVTWTAG